MAFAFGGCANGSNQGPLFKGVITGDEKGYMSYSLNSLKGGYIGNYIGDYYRGY